RTWGAAHAAGDAARPRPAWRPPLDPGRVEAGQFVEAPVRASTPPHTRRPVLGAPDVAPQASRPRGAPLLTLARCADAADDWGFRRSARGSRDLPRPAGPRLLADARGKTRPDRGVSLPRLPRLPRCRQVDAVARRLPAH